MLHNKSYDSMIDFLSMAGSKGLIKPATANSIRSSCVRVFKILEDNEKTDMEKIDVDEIFNRFQNLHGTSFTPNSLRVHKSRIATARNEFLRYAANPSGYSRTPNNKKDNKRSNNSKANSNKEQKNEQGLQDNYGNAQEPPVRLLDHNIAIRSDCVVTIKNVPIDLKEHEAARIGAFIKTLVMVYDSEKEGGDDS